MTTQGIPDDLRPAEWLPLDIERAVASLAARLLALREESQCMQEQLQFLDERIGEVRRALTDIRERSRF